MLLWYPIIIWDWKLFQSFCGGSGSLEICYKNFRKQAKIICKAYDSEQLTIEWPPFKDKIEVGGLMNLFNLLQSINAVFFPFTSASNQNAILETHRTCHPQNFYFQSYFSASKINGIFLNFELTRRSTFINEIFENFNFWSTLFSKNVPNFCLLCS